MASSLTNQTREASRNLGDIKREAQDTLNEARGQIVESAAHLGERVGEIFTSSRQYVTDAADQGIETIRSKPVQSSLVALGVGVLLGILIRR